VIGAWALSLMYRSARRTMPGTGAESFSAISSLIVSFDSAFRYSIAFSRVSPFSGGSCWLSGIQIIPPE